MGFKGWIVVTALATTAVVPVALEGQADRIYGRITTAAGRTYEGFLRWDLNEASWVDLLNGSKQVPLENQLEAREAGGREGSRDRSIEFMGVRVSWTEDEDEWPTDHQSGIRFGHLRALRVLDDDAALLTLRSGEIVELTGGSTDLGSDLRGLVVEDATEGVVELRWRDLDRVDFLDAPEGVPAPAANRLHGTLEDRWGKEYTGYVSWDLDETLTSDILDGKVSGRDRKIPFGEIAAVERYGSGAARVTLTNGEELVMDGSNDVDSDNRGIQVSDPGLGQVQVRWGEFEALRFHAPREATGYDDFDGGSRLRGTVRTEMGDSHTGWIRWDNDEEYSWEILDGEFRGVVYDVELGLVSRIAKRSNRSAEVTLRDGRVLEMEGSNDVDRNNKGILIELDDGSRVLVDWYDFSEVLFQGS